MDNKCVVFFWPPLNQPQDGAFYREIFHHLSEQGHQPFVIAPQLTGLEVAENFGEEIRLKHAYTFGFSTSCDLPGPLMDDLLSYYENVLGVGDRVVAERNISRVLLRMRILFERLRPSMVVFHNYQEAGHKIARHLVEEYRIPYRILERAPLPGYYVAERKSIYGLSEIWNSDLYEDVARPDLQEKELFQSLRDNPLATATESSVDPSGSSGRRILVALEEPYSSGWAYSGSDPVATADYPLGADYRFLLDRLARACENIGARLIARPHPRCQLISRLCSEMNIEVGVGSLREELEVADLVICQNTKVSFSAAVSGKRVILMAANPLGKSGCFPVLSAYEFENNLENVLGASLEALPPDMGKVESFMVWLIREHYFDMKTDGAPRMARMILDERRHGRSDLPFVLRCRQTLRWWLFFRLRELLHKSKRSILGRREE